MPHFDRSRRPSHRFFALTLSYFLLMSALPLPRINAASLPVQQGQGTTLRFNELPFQSVNGLTTQGVTFGFTVNGAASTDANYNSGGPGQGTFVQDPSLEGNANGILSLTFAQPTQVLQFGVALSTSATLTPGFTVQLFDANNNSIGVFPVTTSPQASGFTENQFNYSGQTAVARATVTFNFNGRFAFDNLSFGGTPIGDNSAATPAGNNITVQVGTTTVTFERVTVAGVTTVTPISPASAGTPPPGYTISDASVAFDITTTATFTGSVVVTVTAPFVDTQTRLLHNVGGTLFDRTILPPNSPAPDFANRRISARDTVLGPFVTAQLTAAPTFSIAGRITDASGNPLPGVTVTLSGTQTGTTTTDASGNYSFANLAAGGNYTVMPSLAGFTFMPPSSSFTNLQANQTANFTGTSSGGGITNNYIINQTTGGVIVAGVTDIGNHCDDCTTPITLPFAYTLYDRTFSAARISSNGVILFDGDSDEFDNECLPTTIPGFDYSILGYWDDLRTDASDIPGLGLSGIFTSVTGTAPNRVFNIEWRSTFFDNEQQTINFEIRLYEGQPRFGVVYAQIDQFGSNSTVGVQRTATSGFTEYECNTGGLTPGLQLTFSGSDQLFISGLVTTANGAGISGAAVALSGTTNASATTDASGFYNFNNLTVGGNYTVTPTAPGFTFNPANRTFNNLVTNQTANFVGTGAPVTFNIGGTVRDGLNNRLDGVTMTLSGTQSATTTTDASGNYTFANLAAGGNYTITPARANFTFTPASTTFNNLNSNQTANFTGSSVSFTISGQVTAGGQNLSGVTVTLSGNQSATTTTDASGNYAFANLAAGGNYTVTPSRANFSFTPASQTFNNLSSNQTANFTGTAVSFSISGRVTRVSNGTGRGEVTLTLSGAQSGTTTSDENGNYSFANLAAGGNYVVTPARSNTTFEPGSRSFNNLAANQTGGDFVSTRSESVATPAGANVTIQFLDGLTINFANVTTAGTTTLREIAASTAGALPTGYRLFDSEGIDISTTATTAGAITPCAVIDEVNEAAVFSSLRILHGENGVLVDRTSSQDFGTRTICATVNSLGPFVLAVVQLQTISGQVDSGGASLAGVTISLSGTQSGVTTTDGSGNYSFTVLGGGSYTVMAKRTNFTFTPASLSFPNLSRNVGNANFSGTVVNLSISGRVTDGNGNGLADVGVTLAGAGSQTITTDASGNYTFGTVAANSNYIVTPTRFGFTFTPASQSYSSLSSNQVANFVAAAVPNPTPTPTPSENFDGGTTGPNFTPGTLTTTPTSNNPNVTVMVQNGQLVITPLTGANGANFNGIVLVKPIDLNVTPTVSIEAVQVQDEGTTSFALGNDPDNWYRFAAGTEDSLNQSGASQANAKRSGSSAVRAGVETVKLFFFQTNLGGTKFSTPGVPYDPVQDRFWRFRFGEAVATQAAKAAGAEATPVINFETSPDAKVWTLRYSSAISKPVTGLVAEIAAGTSSAAVQPGKAIFDNFAVSTEGLPVNRIEQADFFVRQQYLDFLNREPDAGGLAYWLNEIQRCGNDARCIQTRRIGVSAAFFIENEFQQTGSFVYQLYQVAFKRRVSFAEFMSDRSRLVVGANLEANKQTLADEFVTRPAFKNIYDHLGSVDYVDALYANAGVAATQEDRAALVVGLLTNKLKRSNVLLFIAENQTFAQQQFNSAFVLTQYFGYLRRDPDEGGFLFWLDVLNNRAPNNYVGMVCAFITSREYQLRFGSTVPRTNADCGTQ